VNAVDLALVGSAVLLGISSVPHCAAMCGAPCAALVAHRRGAAPAFHLGRLLSYAAAGALAAASIGLVGEWARSLHWLLALWMLLQAAMLCAGGYMAATGRMPALNGLGHWTPVLAAQGQPQPIQWHRLRAGAAGGLWAAWPCGALQGALIVAALASGPAGGALAMAAFALASSAGLWMAPWLWARTAGSPLQKHATRVAGALLMLVSAWALWRGLAARVAAWC
jgi:sulfite exporter TauE/SafE